MVKVFFLLVLLAIVVGFTACKTPTYPLLAPAFQPDYPLNRYESTIEGYEQRDAARPPKKGGIAIGGSSSVYFWQTMGEDLAPLPVLNYGFGGSTLPEVLHYADRSLLKYKPKAIVLYCENDLFGGKAKTPAQVRDAYVQLVQHLRRRLPKVSLYFVSLKPSPNRWARWSEAMEVNRLIQDFINTDKRHHYIDITTVMLQDGRPDPVLFTTDSLHMNAEGYRRWTGVIKPILQKHYNQ